MHHFEKKAFGKDSMLKRFKNCLPHFFSFPNYQIDYEDGEYSKLIYILQA